MVGQVARRHAGRAVSDSEWAAFQAGDRTGLVWAVATTGIHCRDGCPGRPLRQNLRILDSRAAAEAAGFRACKRCGGG
ncbi:Ada metal-binding domain-containing protein [Xinfangfangia pollutisoli]|uniref:Ada metal-binding domain-containing protein n=1 Tax=Xinfangfangia pollutisoli TaxID=2865960 RepID=UPI001CD1A36A|nr:Ada metal-binding domain-containing protein [Xinfangfangia pollutisoli]